MSLLIYSDDFGDSWTSAYDDVDDGDAQPVDLIRAGDSGPFFALRDSSGGATGTPATTYSILRSTDGQEWAGFYDPMLWAGVPSLPSGLAYDLRRDELYLCYQDNERVFCLKNATQVSPAAANAAIEAAGANVLLTAAPPYWKLMPSPAKSGKGPRTLTVQKKPPAA